MNPVYRAIANLYPRTVQNYLKTLLHNAGESVSLEDWLGAYTLFSLLIWLAVIIVPWTVYGEFSIGYFFIGLAAAIVTLSFVYIIMYLKFEDRIARIEEVIPDMLQLISSNLRSGLTPYQALNISARADFGPLAEEVKLLIKRSQSTESFTGLLLKMGDNIKSEMLDRVVKMFSSAIKAGGKLAQLLQDIAIDISQTKALKDELVTTTRTYITFILFTIIIGTPLLFAISIHFIELISTLQTGQSGAAGFGMGFLNGELSITADFLIKVSLIMLVITSLLTSMLLGVIKEGKELYGLRYSPILIVGTFTTFFIARYLVTVLFVV
jgi:Flp pilus assembly protein TadB